MERLDALSKASEIAQAMVRINNVMSDDLATYQPERDRVEFYLYRTDDGSSLEHFRFEAVRDEYIIHDVLAGAERYRAKSAKWALNLWASHILGYIH